jgi:hypothetical protein
MGYHLGRDNATWRVFGAYVKASLSPCPGVAVRRVFGYGGCGCTYFSLPFIALHAYRSVDYVEFGFTAADNTLVHTGENIMPEVASSTRSFQGKG